MAGPMPGHSGFEAVKICEPWGDSAAQLNDFADIDLRPTAQPMLQRGHRRTGEHGRLRHRVLPCNRGQDTQVLRLQHVERSQNLKLVVVRGRLAYGLDEKPSVDLPLSWTCSRQARSSVSARRSSKSSARTRARCETQDRGAPR